jgi:4-amino-4-deoxy-L-arabinose transferase-like glycosyltransferase
MDFDALNDRLEGNRLALESAAVFVCSIAFLLALAPAGPFTKELGVCEAGAVRDVLSGNVILPHYAPGIPVQVPPMFWWMAALAVRLVGWNEIALRAPSILAVGVSAAILYAWIGASLSRKAAIWSVAALLSSQYVADASRQPRMDALLMMFLVAAMVCLERAIASPFKRTKMTLLTGAAISMGLAILTKGPLGVILPGLTLVIFMTTAQRLRELFRIEIIVTFAGALVIGALWYLAAFEVGGNQFVTFQIVHGLFRRFLGSAAGNAGECQNPFYYFLPRLVSGFLPWSLFYPALAIMLWHSRTRMPAPIAFALCWFVAVLGFFSISAGKCLVYILPLFPALAAMTGAMIASIAERSNGPHQVRRLFNYASIVIAIGVLLIVVLTGVLILSGSTDALGAHLHRSDQRFLEVLTTAASQGSPAVVLWVTLWLLGGIVALSSSARGRALTLSAAIALIALAGTIFWYGFLNPALAMEVTLKPFSSVVDGSVPSGARIDYIGQPDCDLGFYSNHQIASVKNFQCEQTSSDAYFIVWQDRLRMLSANQSACLAPLAQSSAIDSHGARVLMIKRK